MRGSLRCFLILLCVLCPSLADAGFFCNARGRKDSGSAELVHLWKGTPVHCGSVTLEVFLPDSPRDSVGVIVCPGGSYCWLDYEHEGTDVAKWLCSNGIAAFVLRYRVQGKFQFATWSRLFFGGRHHPDMITDLQRAIQYVRENQQRFGVNTLGAMGFSAGGHLVMSSAEFSGTDFLAPHGIVADVSLRPDFVAPMYPVVTMRPPYAHKRSRRALLGEYHMGNKAMRDSLSMELHVPEDCPPVFLAQCRDDKVVDYHNSVLLDSALTARGIPHSYILYERGGHGFGVSETKGSPESRTWKESFLLWLREIILQKKNPDRQSADQD